MKKRRLCGRRRCHRSFRCSAGTANDGKPYSNSYVWVLTRSISGSGGRPPLHASVGRPDYSLTAAAVSVAYLAQFSFPEAPDTGGIGKSVQRLDRCSLLGVRFNLQICGDSQAPAANFFLVS
jgi:hypothetical protein